MSRPRPRAMLNAAGRPPAALASVPAALWDFPLLPRSASNFAPDVDTIMLALTAFSVFFTALICALILYFIVRYRAGSDADRTHPITRTARYEAVWVAIPTVIALALFAWAAAGYFRMTHAPADAQPVYVVAKQWMWKVQHPGGQQEINELHVPVGVPIKLVMTSQDVIHSFYVPAFRVKRDVLPGRYSELWFVATRPGTYHLFCAEYCGDHHSAMIGRVVVLRPADYEAWMEAGASGPAPIHGTPGTPEAPMALRGEGAFFRFDCAACHLPGARVRAPRLDGIFGRPTRLRNGRLIIADERYLRESILEPNAKVVAGYDAPSLMPTYRGQLTDTELNELVEFIRSIRYGWAPKMHTTQESQDTQPQ